MWLYFVCVCLQKYDSEKEWHRSIIRPEWVFACMYLLTMWMRNEAATTTHPQPPSGGTGISSTSQLLSSLLLLDFRRAGPPWAILCVCVCFLPFFIEMFLVLGFGVIYTFVRMAPIDPYTFGLSTLRDLLFVYYQFNELLFVSLTKLACYLLTSKKSTRRWRRRRKNTRLSHALCTQRAKLAAAASVQRKTLDFTQKFDHHAAFIIAERAALLGSFTSLHQSEFKWNKYTFP